MAFGMTETLLVEIGSTELGKMALGLGRHGIMVHGRTAFGITVLGKVDGYKIPTNREILKNLGNGKKLAI